VGELLSRQSLSGSSAPEQSFVSAVQRSAEEDCVATDWNVGDKILDLYEVTGILGEGGMGKVYKVRHNGWNVDLAVKSPRAELLTKKHAIENFETEAKTWVNLGMYPHTVSCYYVRRLGGTPRVFAEYVAGGNLKEWIESGKLYEGGADKALKRILDIAIQFAWGLHYAHEQGLVHQDVKPANVMMTPGGTAKVTDFGLAKARAVAGEVTATKGQSILVSSGGMTPAYCSPEQANGEKLTRKTDIWSWAVSVLEMFTGNLTWPSGTVAGEALELLLEMGRGDEAIPAMPASLAELLRKCFQKYASQRPKDMQLIADRLQEIFERSTGTQFERSEPKAAKMMAAGLNNRGVSLLDLGRTDDAEKALDDALRQDPHHPEAVFNLGLLRWRNARCTDTQLLTHLEEVGNSRPNDGKVAFLKGLVHLERWDIQSSIEELEKAKKTYVSTEVESALKHARRLLPLAENYVRTFEGHTHTVTSVCFSPNGFTCLSGSWDETLRLWEVSSGRCLRIFEGHTNLVNSVTFSPDGLTCLSGSWDQTVRLWDISSGRCLRIFDGHTNSVDSVTFSPDGHYCLADSGNMPRMWEISSGRCLWTIKKYRMWESIYFSPDGRYCLSGDDRTRRLLDIHTGSCLRTFEGHTDTITSSCFSADGRYYLSGSYDKMVRFWEVSSGQCLWTLEGHTGWVMSVCFSLDGRHCLSGSKDATLRLWEVSSGRCLRTFEGHNGAVNSVCISPDGRHCLSGSDDETIRLWEMSSGRCLRTFDGHTTRDKSLCFSPDGHKCLSVSYSGDTPPRLWDVSLYLRDKLGVDSVLSQPMDVEEAVRSNRYFAELIDKVDYYHSKGDESAALECLDRARGLSGKAFVQELLDLNHSVGRHCRAKNFLSGRMTRTFKLHSRRGNSVAFSPDGRFCCTESDGPRFQLWDVSSGRCLRIFEGHNALVKSVCFSPDGRTCLSGSADKTLRLWEVASGRCLRTFEGHWDTVDSVCFSPDGRYCLSGSGTFDPKLRLWEVSTGRCLQIFQINKGTVAPNDPHSLVFSSVTFSPDGRYCLSGGNDRTVRLWDVFSGECLRTYHGHDRHVTSVVFSPDGRHCLSGSHDKTLRLWDVSSGRCLRIFEGHNGMVSSVCYSPDGRYCLSGSADKTIRLWDVSLARCVRTFLGHSSYVSSVCFSADGRTCLSGSADETIRLWELVWAYDFPGWSDWNEDARPYLENFLTILCATSENGTSSAAKPEWQPKDFEMLIEQLQHRGLGYIRPEGIRTKLEQLAADWTGAPFFTH
jgi:WD40 repeat protein